MIRYRDGMTDKETQEMLREIQYQDRAYAEMYANNDPEVDEEAEYYEELQREYRSSRGFR